MQEEFIIYKNIQHYRPRKMPEKTESGIEHGGQLKPLYVTEGLTFGTCIRPLLIISFEP